MCVSNRELVKGNVITDFKWEVKEDMDAVLSGEHGRHSGKFQSARGESGLFDQIKISRSYSERKFHRHRMYLIGCNMISIMIN